MANLQSTFLQTSAAKRGRSARRLKLLVLNPHCHHCGRKLSPANGRFDSASVVGGLLSCPAHINEVGKAAMQQRSRQRSKSPEQLKEAHAVKKLRQEKLQNKMKHKLFNANPHCFHCGEETTIRAKQANTATLIGDKLACRFCYDMLRLDQWFPRDGIASVYALEHKLKVPNPSCHACGLQLSWKPGKVNSANVVGNRWSCPAHIELVRASCTAVETASVKGGER